MVCGPHRKCLNTSRRKKTLLICILRLIKMQHMHTQLNNIAVFPNALNCLSSLAVCGTISIADPERKVVSLVSDSPMACYSTICSLTWG